eukprot:gene20865-27703_t
MRWLAEIEAITQQSAAKLPAAPLPPLCASASSLICPLLNSRAVCISCAPVYLQYACMPLPAAPLLPLPDLTSFPCPIAVCISLPGGFGQLLRDIADGTFICWLVMYVTGQSITGIHRRPLADGPCRTNWLKAIELLRGVRSMSRRFLNYEGALIGCEYEAVLGLLEDLHRLDDGQPPWGVTAKPSHPYLPRTMENLQQQADAVVVPAELLAVKSTPLSHTHWTTEPLPSCHQADAVVIPAELLAVNSTPPRQVSTSKREGAIHWQAPQPVASDQPRVAPAAHLRRVNRNLDLGRSQDDAKDPFSLCMQLDEAYHNDVHAYIDQQLSSIDPQEDGSGRTAAILAVLPHLRLVKKHRKLMAVCPEVPDFSDPENVMYQAGNSIPGTLLEVVHSP